MQFNSHLATTLINSNLNEPQTKSSHQRAGFPVRRGFPSAILWTCPILNLMVRDIQDNKHRSNPIFDSSRSNNTFYQFYSLSVDQLFIIHYKRRIRTKKKGSVDRDSTCFLGYVSDAIGKNRGSPWTPGRSCRGQTPGFGCWLACVTLPASRFGMRSTRAGETIGTASSDSNTCRWDPRKDQRLQVKSTLHYNLYFT